MFAMYTNNLVNEHDILCGRGGGSNNNNGNIIFRQMVASRQSSYLNAQKDEKKLIAKAIVDEIRNKGGRFLKYNDRGELEDIGDIKASEKTCQALREGMDIRAHKRKLSDFLRGEHQRDNQIRANSYPPIDHSFESQRYYNTYPSPYQAPRHHHPAFEQNYRRTSHLHGNFYHDRGEVSLNYNNYYREAPQHKPYYHYQPKYYSHKDCYNTRDYMREAHEAQSKVSERSQSVIHSHDTNTLSNKKAHHEPPQSSSFTTYFGHGYHQGMPGQGEVSATMNHRSLPFSTSSHEGYHRLKANRVGCRCQKIQCIKRYCECFNVGVKCGPLCQCRDCENK